MDVQIRTMERKDVPHVAAVDKESFAVPWSEDAFLRELDNPVAKYFVAEVHGAVIGYAGIWCVLDEGHMTNVAVLPAFRRQGIAACLLTQIVEYAKEKSLSFIMLEVRESNLAAQTLYRKFGFSAHSIRKQYYRDNREDAIIMLCRLQETGV